VKKKTVMLLAMMALAIVMLVAIAAPAFAIYDTVYYDGKAGTLSNTRACGIQANGIGIPATSFTVSVTTKAIIGVHDLDSNGVEWYAYSGWEDKSGWAIPKRWAEWFTSAGTWTYYEGPAYTAWNTSYSALVENNSTYPQAMVAYWRVLNGGTTRTNVAYMGSCPTYDYNGMARHPYATMRANGTPTAKATYNNVAWHRWYTYAWAPAINYFQWNIQSGWSTSGDMSTFTAWHN
jgi:hypothetical protein